MAWRGPAMTGAGIIVGGLLVWHCLSLRKRICDMAMLIPMCHCSHSTPATIPMCHCSTVHHAGQAGGRVPTRNASTMTDLQGLAGIQLVEQLILEAQAEGVDPQRLAAAISHHQPTEAPAAPEHEAGHDQGDPLERATLESAAGDSRQLQPEHPSPFEEVALQQEQSMASGSTFPADPEGVNAFGDVEDTILL